RSLSQIIVSVSDLEPRLEKWIYRQDEAASSADANSTPEAGKDRVVMSGTVEEQLTVLWRNFFGNQEINVDDDFFEIGGDSLKALTMIGRIHKVLNVEISIKEFFSKSTIRKLSEYIERQGASNGHAKTYSRINKAPDAEYFVLSAAQRRLYFLYEFDRRSLAYNLPRVIRLTGTLDKERLRNALHKLIGRHESLRTSFSMKDGQPVQKIHSVYDFELESFSCTEADCDEVIRKFIRPFNLASAPLFRAGIIDTDNDQHILIVDIHHVVTDGVSQDVLVRDFTSLYEGEELTDLNLQYKDFAVWQQSEPQQRAIASQKDFWMNEFAEEVCTLDLPFDYQRPLMKTYQGHSIAFGLSPEDTARLKGIAEQEGSTMFMVLLGFYTILLSKLSNQEDIIVGTPAAGRLHADLENIIGMFINTVPLRNSPKHTLTFLEYLRIVTSKTLAAFDHQSYPYEELINDLKVGRETSRNQLCDVMFSYQNFEQRLLAIPGLQIELLDNGHKISKFDLLLTATENNGSLLFNFEYATAIFKSETVERFALYFCNIISEVLLNVDARIGDIKMLPKDEEQSMLHVVNNTNTTYPRSETIISMFDKQVERTPDRIALRFADLSLTYQALQHRSEQIAFHLVDTVGVQRGDLVGVMLERETNLLPVIF